MIRRIDILTHSQCEIANETIDKMHDLWIPRHPAMQFYTLGLATYLDHQEEYRRKKDYYNELLNKNLSWLYSIVTSSLENVIGPSELEDSLSFPGFHIIGHKPGERNNMNTTKLSQRILSSSIHIDKVIEPNLDVLKNKYSNVLIDSTLSITLPISLPTNGGGICIWNNDDIKLDTQFSLNVKSLYNKSVYGIPTVEEYITGQAFMFPGNVLHQMAPAVDPTPEDRRITFQAHAVLCDDVWRLFF